MTMTAPTTSKTAFDNICTIPLESDLFAQLLHPTEPLVTIGLANGRVQLFRLPPAASSSDEEQDEEEDDNILLNGGSGGILSQRRRSSTASENGLGSIESLWSTRRHKGSCRALCHSFDGRLTYSAGTDGLVKSFETETGRVVGKIAVPSSALDVSEGTKLNTLEGGEVEDKAPTFIHALSPQTLLLGTDSGFLHLFDLRDSDHTIAAKPKQSWNPHAGEHVNAITPLPVSETSTSGFPNKWVSVGGSTLTLTDLRKGILKTSEDQEVELTSLSIVTGLKKGGTSVGEKVLVGQADGVVSLWEMGVWDDQDERIVIDRGGGGIEVLSGEIPMELAMGMGRGKVKMNEKIIASGLEDGRVRFARIGRNIVLNEWDLVHDELDGVVGLDFDAAGRIVSGGGMAVKVWTEAKGAAGANGIHTSKRSMGDSDDEDSEAGDDSEEDSDEEEKPSRAKRKKRKRNKGKDKSGGQVLQFSGTF